MVRKIFGKDAVIVSGILGLVLYMLSGVLSAVFYVKAVLIISYVLLGYTAIGGVILTAETRGRPKLQRIQLILLGFTEGFGSFLVFFSWFLLPPTAAGTAASALLYRRDRARSPKAEAEPEWKKYVNRR